MTPTLNDTDFGTAVSRDITFTRIRTVAHGELIINLIRRDITTRYKQSALGLAWAVVNPLIMAAIYTLLGVYFLRQTSGRIPFPIYAYTGLLFWNLFSTGVNSATESLVAHISLITKIYFPREVFPLSAVLGKVVDLFFGLIGLVPLLLIFRVPVGPGILLLIPLTLVVLLLATGIGLLTACANLFYRDVRHVVGLVLNLWIYLVPNFYNIDQIPPQFRQFYLLNPLAALIQAARLAMFPQLGGEIPWRYVGLATALSVVLFVVGYATFKRYEPQFAESI